MSRPDAAAHKYYEQAIQAQEMGEQKAAKDFIARIQHAIVTGVGETQTEAPHGRCEKSTTMRGTSSSQTAVGGKDAVLPCHH